MLFPVLVTVIVMLVTVLVAIPVLDRRRQARAFAAYAEREAAAEYERSAADPRTWDDPADDYPARDARGCCRACGAYVPDLDSWLDARADAYAHAADPWSE